MYAGEPGPRDVPPWLNLFVALDDYHLLLADSVLYAATLRLDVLDACFGRPGTGPTLVSVHSSYRHQGYDQDLPVGSRSVTRTGNVSRSRRVTDVLSRVEALFDRVDVDLYRLSFPYDSLDLDLHVVFWLADRLHLDAEFLTDRLFRVLLLAESAADALSVLW